MVDAGTAVDSDMFLTAVPVPIHTVRPADDNERTTPTMKLALADLTDDDREQIDLTFHEAGHSIAAVALGGTLRSSVVASNRATGKRV